MNTTTVLSPSARGYLERVTELLGDLPGEERGELVQDLEAHLAELGDDQVEARLGTPEEFVAEFRAMAGLGEPAPDGGSALRRRWDELARAIASLRHTDLARTTAAAWTEFRPAWAWIRGWLAVAAAAVLWGGQAAFAPFPIPVANDALGGLIWVVAATTVSVAVARRIGAGRWWRPADRAFNALVACLLVGSLGSGWLFTDDYVWRLQDEQTTILGEAIPMNLVAHDLQGRRLDGVLLYDEEGRPFELADLHQRLGLWVEYQEVRYPEDDRGTPVRNRYPLDLYVYEYDLEGNARMVPFGG